MRRKNPKNENEKDNQNRYLKLISQFEYFIKNNKINTLQDISVQELNDIINDIENSYIDFINGPNKEIYVILKSNYVQDRRISKQKPINLLICAIFGIYCYVPIIHDFEEELKNYNRNYSFNVPYFQQISENREVRKDHYVNVKVLTFIKHKINKTVQLSNFYIFDDSNYLIIISFVKDNFISNFFYLIDKYKLVSKLEFDSLHTLVYKKFIKFIGRH